MGRDCSPTASLLASTISAMSGNRLLGRVSSSSNIPKDCFRSSFAALLGATVPSSPTNRHVPGNGVSSSRSKCRSRRSFWTKRPSLRRINLQNWHCWLNLSSARPFWRRVVHGTRVSCRHRKHSIATSSGSARLSHASLFVSSKCTLADSEHVYVKLSRSIHCETSWRGKPSIQRAILWRRRQSSPNALLCKINAWRTIKISAASQPLPVSSCMILT